VWDGDEGGPERENHDLKGGCHPHTQGSIQLDRDVSSIDLIEFFIRLNTRWRISSAIPRSARTRARCCTMVL
jgi:hypothetical protein